MKPKMFDAAYIRLTMWYVAIIMVISLLFSLWVYNQATQELRFGLNRIVQFDPFDQDPQGGVRGLINERLEDSRHRLIVRLASLNIVVLVVGAGTSYWLARRTMRPIEESVNAQHRFTADASHELRTPLAAMRAEIEVGLRDKKLSKEDAVSLLKSNLEEIERLGMLADGLLALTQTDDPSFEPKPVSLEDVAGKVAKRLQPLADAKHIEIKRDLRPVITRTDEAGVDKIIGILLDNAIKYSDPSTVVSLSTLQKDDYAYITVKDQGIGIKASELPHVFDRFYRADSSRSKSHVTGHGLGLSIAQQLVENMGGTITATSTPGKGSSFTVRLPFTD